MSLPQTGGPGLAWVIAGVILIIRGIVRKIFQNPFTSVGLILVGLFLSQVSGAISGFHWDSFSNDDGWVLRGATEQHFGIRKGKFSFGLTLGEEHAFGSDPERPWTREIKFFTGPIARSAFVFGRADLVLSSGVNLMAGLRPNQHDLVISPYATCGVNWRVDKSGRFPGYAWGIIRGRSLYERGFLTSGSFEQGYNLFSVEKGKLTGCLYIGSWFIYGERPEYYWNRKGRVLVGFRAKYNLRRCVLQGGVEGYHQWGGKVMNALRVYTNFSMGWN